MLADIYSSEGNDNKAIRLYNEGLKVDSWKLEYQLKLAKLLKKCGDTSTAAEKAKIVREYAEDEQLILDSENLLKGLGTTDIVDEKGYETANDVEIVIVPLGRVNKRLLHEVKDELQKIMGIKYSISQTSLELGTTDRSSANNLLGFLLKKIISRLNKKAFWQMNGQHDASGLLSNIQNAFKIEKGSNIKGYLGVTEADIFAKDYNFLFGWAGKGYGVASYHRFRAVFAGESPQRPRLRKRTVKQCISSSFHILGIPRCTTPTCAQAYPHSLIEHDQKSLKICSWCKERLALVVDKSN
jgi:predicted Zn-dependent protease